MLLYIVCKVRQALTGEQCAGLYQGSTSLQTPEARLSCCALMLAFAVGPSWFEVWLCLHIQMRPHWKSFHLFFKHIFLHLPQSKNHSYRKSGKGILHSLWHVQGRLERSYRRKEKVILIVLILQMIYHIQIYAEFNCIHYYLSLFFSRHVYLLGRILT